jgi:hypothetical protein
VLQGLYWAFGYGHFQKRAGVHFEWLSMLYEFGSAPGYAFTWQFGYLTGSTRVQGLGVLECDSGENNASAR